MLSGGRAQDDIMSEPTTTNEDTGGERRLIRMHDQFAKLVLDRPGNADTFLRERLPAPVTALLTAEPATDRSESFVDPLLAELRGDRVHSFGLSDGRPLLIWTVTEHKSAGEGDSLIQVLGYLNGAAIRGARRVQNPDGTVRVVPALVLAVILYHGTGRWPHPPTFGEAYGMPKEFLAAGPIDFSYTLVDLSTIPDAELSRDPDLQAGLLMLKYATRDGDPEITLERLLSAAAVIGLTVLRAVVRYLFVTDEDRNRDRLRAVLGRVVPGQEDKIMPTIAEAYIAEGKAEAKADTLLRMVGRRLGTVPATVTAKVASASVDEIDQWIDAITDGTDVNEIFREATH
ncbi:hypothetical protein N825_14725 [Skermanella stibiiresistens SB22]|uniref:Transposase (putative) YhgA-like domain-containing protein n=2 Tax=Skermanella TaxID=204447 RepID=W9GWQ6_9PROT|nr:hypothetical protein N825_14725 [Skermanella stibiiresistens SB22]